MRTNSKFLSIACAMIFFLCSLSLQAQDRITISGIITDSDGSPLVGATVMETETKNITICDLEGKYSLDILPGKEITFSYMGFKTVKQTFAKSQNFDLEMEADASLLEGTVVTAMGINREKKSLGYAIQEISGEELSQSAENNVVRALSGKSAGVFITGGSSGLGGSNNIIIRGNTNLSGNNMPMFVVDNVPMYNDEKQTQSFWDANNTKGKVDWGNPISKFNINDIESMTVLKGAAATALYGSRAANGVIVITTKKGSRKDNQFIGIDYSFNMGLVTPSSIPHFQQEYGSGTYGLYEYTGNRKNPGWYENEWKSWGRKFDGETFIKQYGSPTLHGEILPIPWRAHPDNIKNFLTTGTLIENSIGININSDSTYGRISFQNSTESGMVPMTDETRNNININFTSNLTKKWSVDLTANYTESSSDNRVPGFGNGIVQQLMQMPSNFDIVLIRSVPWKKEDGSKNVFCGDINPYWTLNEDFNAYKRKNLMGSLTLRYKFKDWLQAGVSVRKNWSDGEYRYFEQIDTFLNQYGKYFNDGAYRLDRDAYDSNEFNFTLNGYLQPIQDVLTLSYNLGAEYRRSEQTNWNAGVDELIMPDIASLINGRGPKTVRHTITRQASSSIYGLVSLGFKNYLFLDITGRNDWTSTLAPDYWSYFYPSASLSFIFTEAFNIDKKIFPYGKIRANIAKVGSATSPYQLVGAWNINNQNFNNQQMAGYTNTIPKYDLKPQMTRSIEFGTELAFFDRRIQLDLAYYKTNTFNQITSVGIPQESGFGYTMINTGNLQNEGIEAMLTVQPVKVKDFLWEMNFNFSHNRNKLVQLDDKVRFIRTGWNGFEMRVTEGSYYGDIYGYDLVTNDEGQYIVMDNGYPYRTQDYPGMNWDKYLGNASPKFLAAASTRFTYKDLSLSLTFSSRFGGVLYSQSHAENMRYGLLDDTIGLNDKGIDKRLRIDQDGGMRFPGVVEVKNSLGEVTGYKENETYLEAQEYYNWLADVHSLHLFKSDFIKLQEVALSYRMPKKLMKKIKFIEDIQFSLVGSNLATLLSYMPNGLDPEVCLGNSNAGQGIEAGALPAERRFGFKLNVKF